MDRLDLMQIYVDIHDIGSMAGVARQRNIAPSAVTQALQKLEQYVGVTLIMRTTRRMYFTPEGEQFLHHCRSILGKIKEALDHVNQNGPLRGTIRFTATNDFGRTRLPLIIDEFLELHPQIKVDLHLSDGVVDLIGERFDFAIRTGPLVDSEFKARRLTSQKRYVCAAPIYWANNGKPTHPRELLQHNCLVLARPNASQSEWHFIEQGKSFAVKISGNRLANDGGVLRQWAINGAGVAVKGEFDIEEDLKAGRLECVLTSFTHQLINLYAVYPGHRPSPNRVLAMIDFIVDRLKV